MSRSHGALIRNTATKRPVSGPGESVGHGTGDRTATKSVFPAETGKTDRQKGRIILTLIHMFLTFREDGHM